MIELYEDENKVYAENYSKIREVINRSDIQKANNFNERYVNYRGYTETNQGKKHIFLVKSQSSYTYYTAYILIKNNNIKEIIIAYEPAWSIGTGKIPSKDILSKIIKYIFFHLFIFLYFCFISFNAKKSPLRFFI